MYGEEIKLTYKGDDTFKTNLGAFFSLVLILMLAGYSLFRTYVLFSRKGTSMNGISSIFNLDLEEPFTP